MRVAPVTFMAFDVLMLDGMDVCSGPWSERRRLLEELHAEGGSDVWRVNTAFADGPGLLSATADMGLEGVVAKRRTSRYAPGRRTKHWRKVKHQSVGWFDLLGWRNPGVSTRDHGGLIVAENGKMIGRAFPGLPKPERRRFLDVLSAQGTEAANGVELPAGVAQVQVAYLERMPGGRLREPVARAVRVGHVGPERDPSGSGVRRPDGRQRPDLPNRHDH